MPRVVLVIVDPELGAAVVRDPDGALRLVGRGDILVQAGDTPPCRAERFFSGSLECLEDGPGGRRLHVAESEAGKPSRVGMRARCSPEPEFAPSGAGDLPPP